jgi:hypothetical protein
VRISDQAAGKSAAHTVQGEALHIAGVDPSQLPSRDLMRLSGLRSHHFQTVLRQSTLNKIRNRGDADFSAPAYGVLVGNLYRDQAGTYLLVEHSLEIRTAADGDISFSEEIWTFIWSAMNHNFPTLRVVGWYVIHPGHSGTITEIERAVHEKYFDQKWQVAYMYDPHDKHERVYGGPPGAVKRCDFLIEVDEMITSDVMELLPFEAAALAAAEAAKTAGTEVPVVVKPPRRSIWSRLGVALMALGLFGAAGYLLSLLLRQLISYLPTWHQLHIS